MTDLVDEYAALEQQADAFLSEADPEGTDRGLALTRQLRATLKRHRTELEKAVTQAREQVRAELATERKTEAAFRRLGVPEAARVLFAGIDPADEQAMAEQAQRLRAAGIAWGDDVPAPEPPKADPNMVALEQMQRAAAGGMGSPEPWDVRLRRMAADPGAFTDKERDDVVGEFNKAVRAAERPSSGALG